MYVSHQNRQYTKLSEQDHFAPSPTFYIVKITNMKHC